MYSAKVEKLDSVQVDARLALMDSSYMAPDQRCTLLAAGKLRY